MQFWGKVVQITGFVCPSWDPSLVVVSVIHTEFVKLIFLEKIKVILATLRMIQLNSLIFKFFPIILTFAEAISPSDYFSDQQLELLRALEMSRLQFLREMGSLKPGSGDR